MRRRVSLDATVENIKEKDFSVSVVMGLEERVELQFIPIGGICFPGFSSSTVTRSTGLVICFLWDRLKSTVLCREWDFFARLITSRCSG